MVNDSVADVLSPPALCAQKKHDCDALQKRARVIQSIIPALWPTKGEFDGIGSNSVLSRPYISYGAARMSSCDAQDIARLAEWVIHRLHMMPAQTEWKLRLVLDLMSTRLGTLLLIGPKCLTRRPPFVTAFWDLPLRRIESILLRWLISRTPILRLLARGLKSLCIQSVVACPARHAPGSATLYGAAALQSIGYDGRPPSKPLSHAAQDEEDALQGCMFALAGEGPHVRCSISEIVHELEKRRLQATCLDKQSARKEALEWVPRDVAVADAAAVIECDVLVIGSGCGGGVTAAVLAAAGLRVLVVEKGPYVHPSAIPRADDAAFAACYENATLNSATDTGMCVLAGTGVGGGSRINWCASFRTPPHVRREWAQRHGMAFVDTPRFTRALDVVCGRLGVHCDPEYKRDRAATALQRGLTALDGHFDMIPQNCTSPDACEKHCSAGCAAGGKRDTPRAFLAPAAATGNLTVLCLTAAHTIITEACAASSNGGRTRRASGAVLRMETNADGPPSSNRGGRVGSASGVLIAVKARAVVAAAGALHTPALLLRSDIRGRGNVGRHLRLHPATYAIAEFAPGAATESKTLTQFLDAPQMSVYSRQRARWPPLDTAADIGSKFNTDGPASGYGAFVSVYAALPGTFAAAMPFRGRFQLLHDVMNVSNMAGLLCYTRDQGRGGRITLNGEGQPAIQYRASKATQRAMSDAVDLMLRSMHAAGATRLVTSHDEYLEFSRDVSSSLLFETAKMPSFESRRSGESGKSDATAGSNHTPVARRKSESRRVSISGGATAPPAAPRRPSSSGSAQRSTSTMAAPAGPLASVGAFEQWLRVVRRKGASPLRMVHFSAHQMGSARMGDDRSKSVVDTQGESWDVAGLWVADASVFPTATGVNPMVTIEALSVCIAENVASDMLGSPFEYLGGQLPTASGVFEW